jgi:hypothetical protein
VDIQMKLLVALQERQIERFTARGRWPIADFTPRNDLEHDVRKAGSGRPHYRLNVFPCGNRLSGSG